MQHWQPFHQRGLKKACAHLHLLAESLRNFLLLKGLRAMNLRDMSSLHDASTPALGHLGRFQLHERLGQGGMGVVYRAWDPEMSCDVAVKTLHSIDPTQLRAIKQEFRALADLDHPNIIRMFELFAN